MLNLRTYLTILLLIPCGFVRTSLAINRAAQNAGFTGDTERAIAIIQASGGSNSDAAGSALGGAAGGGRQDTIARLLSAGVPIDTTDGNGGTALQYAAMQGQTETVRFLLEHGAKANLAAHCSDPECKGHFAIISAVRGGKIEIVKMLLQAGADPNVLDNFATQKANNDGNIEMYRLLTDFGGRATSSSAVNGKVVTTLTTVPSARAAASTISKLGFAEALSPNRVTTHDQRKQEKLRLAVIADEPNVNAADLLTAKLSQRSSIELVERQELVRILAEQNLTRQFATDAANYSKIAALLHADALLLIHNRDLNGTLTVESRLIRVDPGLVLNTHYHAAPLSDLPEWVTQMERRIDRFSNRVINANSIALSFLNLRASLGAASSRNLEGTLNTVLQARLSIDPSFVLLERNAMQRLMFEDPAHPFCSGAYLVDGSIEPALDNSGAFKMNVRFKPAIGKGQTVTINASGHQSDPAPAIDAILRELYAHLAPAAPIAASSSADEAQDYLKEAEWALSAGLGTLAKSAADSAWALGLHNLAVARIRVLGPLHAMEELRAKIYANIKAATPRNAGDVHDWLNHPARGADCPTPAEWLDLAIDGVSAWKETLESRLIHQPGELKGWLELAPEVQSGLALGLSMIDTANEQSQQAERLDILRQVVWQSLQTAQQRASELPAETACFNPLAELQAKSVRLALRQPAAQLAAIRDLLKLHFAKYDSLTRAHIRLVLKNWDSVNTIVIKQRSTTTISLPLPSDDEVRKSLISQLRTSPDPEDRFFSGLLEISTRCADPAEAVERIKGSLWDMRDLLAQDRDTAKVYLTTFGALADSGIHGVPFFQFRTTGTEPNLRQELPPEYHAYWTKLETYIMQHAGQVVQHSSLYGGLPPALAEVTPPPDIVAAHQHPSKSYARPKPTPLAVVRVNDAKPLQIERFWTPFGRLQLPSNFQLHSFNASWCDGRIWLYGCGRTLNPPQLQRCFFSVDPVTMQTDMTALPIESVSEENGTGFAVTSSHIVVAVLNDYLAVFDRAAQHWEFYHDVKPRAGDTPVISNNSVFLFVSENPGSALIRFDLKSRTAEVLASTRRHLAVSPLDDPRLQFVYLGQDDAGNVVVEARSDERFSPYETYAWSPATREWKLVHPLAPTGTMYPQTNMLGAGWPQHGLVFAGAKRPDGSVPRTMRLRLQTGADFEIPLSFCFPQGMELPQYGISKPLEMFNGSWRVCPAGIIFVPPLGGFWFLPNEKLTAYVNELQTLTPAMNQTASNH